MSCKNRTSNERCKNPALKTFQYCGTHMRSKTIRDWMKENSNISVLIQKVQALWKGYFVRLRLKYAGPGVLNRKLCHNEEELVTLETKDKLNPFEYFSVEEDGKIWWFDQRTINELALQSVQIKNPYTRTVFKNEDFTRLRNLRLIKHRRKEPLIHTVTREFDLVELRDISWIQIVQIMHECGFTDLLVPQSFISLERAELKQLFFYYKEFIRKWSNEINNPESRREKHYKFVNTMFHSYHLYTDPLVLSRVVAKTIFMVLNDMNNPTPLVFFLLGAYAKLDISGLVDL
jgi:hypothetical protein